MSAVHYENYTDARTHLERLLDAAERGRVATVRRDARTTALVDTERLRCLLAVVTPSRTTPCNQLREWLVGPVR